MKNVRPTTWVPETEAGSEPGSPLGIVIIDPLPTVRAGLRLLIESQPDMEVLVEAGSAGEALEDMTMLQRGTKMLVLLGLGLSGERDSFTLIRTIREKFPTYSIVGCGADAPKTSISRAFFMGADGFVDKNTQPERFVAALRDVAAGKVVLEGPPEEWVGAIAKGIERQEEMDSLLTDREQQVLALASEGITAREIGLRLGLAERTVTTHLHRIYIKLGVRGRMAAVQVAVRSGLVPSSTG